MIPEPEEIDPGHVAEVCAQFGIQVLGPPPEPVDSTRLPSYSMTAVLVHGVPETTALWGAMTSHLAVNIGSEWGPAAAINESWAGLS